MDKNQNNSDLSILLQYSESLSKSAEALLKAADKFGKSVDDMDKTAGRFNGEFKKSTKDFSDEFEVSFTENQKSTKAYGQAFLKSLRTIGSYFIKDLTSAYSKASSSFESNLTRITTSYQISNREYRDMLNEMTSLIKSRGMMGQFTQADWTEKLSDTLSQGIRGPQAQEMAYRNMIANKLLPALQTNTRAYIQMSKTFGKKFDENMLAFGKYTETILSAEGYEQGKIDSMLNTLQAQIRYTAAQRGWGDDQTNKALNTLSAIISWSEKANINSEDFIQRLYSGSTTTPGGLSTLMSYTEGIGTPSQVGNALSDYLLETYGKYLGNYLKNGGTATNLTAFTNAVGSDVVTGYEINAALGFGKGSVSETLAEIQALVDGFDSGTAYDGLIDRLQSGDFTSTTSKYENWMMNTVSPVANTLSLWLPNSATTLSMIVGIIGTWFNAWRSTGGGIGGTGSGSGRGGRLARLLPGGGGIGGAGGALVGAGSFLAATAWMGIDAYRGATSTSDNKVLAGIRGALTGRTYTSDNDKLAAALAGQHRDFDVGSMFANAGKGALLGAGIGTASAGWAAGTGTVIGAAIGAVSAGATNAIDQLIENAKYNKLADATSELTKSLTTLSEATSSYTQVLDKNKELEESLSVLQNKSNKGTQAYSKALDTILKYYPEYTESIKKSGEASETILNAIENYADYERLVAQNNLRSAAEDSRNKRSAYTTASNAFADVLKEEAGYDLASQISAGMTEAELGEAVAATAYKYGLTEKDVVSGYNDVSYKTDSRNWFQKLFSPSASIGVIDGKYNITKTAKGHTIGSKPDYRRDPRVAAERPRILQALQYAEEEYMTYITRLKSWDNMSAEDRELLVSDIRSFVDSAKSAAFEARSYHGIEYNDKMPFSIISDNPEIRAAFGGQVPRFKVGSYSIPNDTPALLHSGEMVLTSTDANALRELASAQGIRGLLSGLLSITKASAVAVDETSAASNPIIEAIQSQTNILSAHLINILEEVKEIKSNTRVHGSGSTISRDLITYQGV